jgi:hypothetical protein
LGLGFTHRDGMIGAAAESIFVIQEELFCAALAWVSTHHLVLCNGFLLRVQQMKETDRALGLVCSRRCNGICPHCFGRFVEAFKLLENAPKEEHCWCTHQKVMDPLLEPFSFYFEEPQSLLHALWRRLCSELNACTKCVIAYHDSKERYKKTYHEAHVEPLLTVLQVYMYIYVCITLFTLSPLCISVP